MRPQRATLQQEQRQCDGGLGGCQSHRNEKTRWSHVSPSCPVSSHYIWGNLHSPSFKAQFDWFTVCSRGGGLWSTWWKVQRKGGCYIKPGALNNPDVLSDSGRGISVLSLHHVCLKWAVMRVLSPDIAASEHIAEMLLSAEESWLQRQADPSTPLLSADQRYDGGLLDVNTPVKSLSVFSLGCFFLYSCQLCHGRRSACLFFLARRVATSSQTSFPPTACDSGTPWGSPSLNETACWRNAQCSGRQVELWADTPPRTTA